VWGYSSRFGTPRFQGFIHLLGPVNFQPSIEDPARPEHLGDPVGTVVLFSCPYSFTKPSHKCKDNIMKKLLPIVTTLVVAGSIFLGRVQAQQTPAPTAQQPASPATPQAPATAPKKAPAAKTGPASAAKSAVPLTLKTPKDKLSYAIGLSIGKTLKQRDYADDKTVDTNILARAIRDVLTDKTPLLTDQEAQTALTAFQAEVRKKQELQMQVAGENNKKEGEAFLAANKTKEGVVTLPSGLQYKILQEGTGPKPTAADTVVVNYRGTLLNGTEFDSSFKRGQPATFGVGQVIKGWTEALQLMPVGSKWQVFIPSDLAYGLRGAGRDIGPNSTLVFEVELLSIQPKAQPAAAPAPSSTPAPAASPTATPTPTPTPTPTAKP
jgi:FKBP-type peptidyl-prolyl cis-trans isomerase